MGRIFKWGALTAALFVMGCGGDETFDFSQFQNATSPPLAVNDTFAVLGNGQLTGSVTANDTVNGAVGANWRWPISGLICSNWLTGSTDRLEPLINRGFHPQPT